jgi:hypothetical protein
MTEIAGIDLEKAPGAFLAGLKHLHVRDDGLDPDTTTEQTDVTAALAELVKQMCAAEKTVGEGLMRRLAMATLDLLSTVYDRSDGHAIVAAWRQAYAEFNGNLR